MPEARIEALPVTVKFAGRDRVITHDKRADWRMGSLDRPFVDRDLKHPKRSFAALIAWLWACLSPKDALEFPSPEDLALAFDPKDIDVSVAAFFETHSAYLALEKSAKNE